MPRRVRRSWCHCWQVGGFSACSTSTARSPGASMPKMPRDWKRSARSGPRRAIRSELSVFAVGGRLRLRGAQRIAFGAVQRSFGGLAEGGDLGLVRLHEGCLAFVEALGGLVVALAELAVAARGLFGRLRLDGL